MPEPRASRGGLGAAGLGLLALVAQVPILDRGVVPIDEGQLVAIADRLLGGEVLYRDVYTGIFPGIYYATAGLFALFGPDVVVTRWAAAVVNAATAVLLLVLGRRAMREPFAWLAPLAYLALVPFAFPALSMLNYSPLALLLALAALWTALRYLESGRAGEGLATGLLLCACGIVKQNFGGLATLAVAAALAWGRPGAPLGRRSLVAAAAPVLLGIAGPALATLGAFALADAALPFLRDTLWVIGESQLAAFDDPIPPILGPHPADDPRFVFAYTPSSLYAYLLMGDSLFGLPMSEALRSAAIRLAYGGTLAALAVGAALAIRPGAPAARGRATRALVLFAGLLFLGLFPSAIWSHLAYVLAPVLWLPALAADRLAARAARRAPALGQAVGVACALTLLGAGAVAAHIAVDLTRWFPEPLGLPRGSLRVSAEQRALYRDGVRFLARCAGPGEPVFVAPDQPLLYFLAERRNPTPYDLLIPGAIDPRRVVERLRDTGTRCVVYNPRMYLQFAPLEELYPEVAAHLAADYRRVGRIAAGGTEWWALRRERKPGS